MDNDITSMRERLKTLSYNDVRKEAKRYGVSGRGKKVEIIEKILEASASSTVIEDTEADLSVTTATETKDVETTHHNHDDEDDMKTAVESLKKHLDSDMQTAIESPLNDVDSEMETAVESPHKVMTPASPHTALNETFTISTHSEEREFLSDDEDHTQNGENIMPKPTKGAKGINASLLSEDAPILSSFTALSSEKSGITADSSHTQTTEWDLMDTQPIGENSMSVENPLTSTPTSAARKMFPRFARQHAALFDKMESITDVDSRIKQRVGQRDDGVSSRLKQLAMPKRAFERAAVFSSPSNPKELSFKFGDVPVEDIARVQRAPVESDTVSAPLQRRSSLRLSIGDSADKKIDVKQLTKSASKMMGRARSASAARCVIHATTPVMTARLERLATPRGRVKPPLDDEEGSNGTPKYTPHKGRYQYVDTTKMTDVELADHLAAKTNKRF